MPLAKLVKTALEETRMLALGAQILLGFELSSAFREGFENFPQYVRYLDGTALILMVVMIALLITPESYHQIVDRGAVTGRFHQLISRLAAAALLPFALSLGIALFIRSDRIFSFAAGLANGCAFAVFASGFWYGFQYLHRRQTGQMERAIPARQ